MKPPASTGATGAIVRAELRLHLRRPAWWLLFGLFTALVVAAAALNGQRQHRERGQQAALQQLVRAQWEGQPERHPHRVAHYGTFAFKPPGALAALDPGVDSYAGRSLYLEAHRQNAANFPEAGDLSAAFRLGELSLAFVLRLALPLVIIALGCRCWADDAESGRLRLLLAQGVAPRALTLGKLLGLAAAIVPHLTIAGLAALVLVVPSAGPATLFDLAARFGVLGTAVALHTGLWLGLTVWVSRRARSTAAACGALVALWVVGAVVAPRAAGALAAARHPLPDKSTFAAAVAGEVRQHGDSHNPNDPHFAKFRADTLARYGVAQVQDLPVNYGAIVMAHGEQLSAEAFARHFATLAARMEAQAGIVERFAFAAPTLALRAISSAAAGTNLGAQLAFQREAEAYRYTFIQHLNELHRDKIKAVGDRDQKLAPEHWRAMPDFAPRPTGWRHALAGTGPAWLALVLWAALPLVALARPRAATP